MIPKNTTPDTRLCTNCLQYNLSTFVVPEWRNKNRPKVWPPHKAPDYLKSTRTLPAGLKVVSEEGEGSRDDERKVGSGQHHKQDKEKSMCVA